MIPLIAQMLAVYMIARLLIDVLDIYYEQEFSKIGIWAVVIAAVGTILLLIAAICNKASEVNFHL